MKEITIFCSPGDSYKRRRKEKTVAEAYTKMAIKDYDKLISFGKSYRNFMESPDYECCVGKKEHKDLVMTAFLDQPIIRIGDIEDVFISSSYLFNLEPLHHDINSNLMLPDLDVVNLKGDIVKEGAEKIKNFYGNHGWQVFFYEEEIPKIREDLHSKRLKKYEDIFNPYELLKIAKENSNYDLEKICFNC